MAQGKLTGRVRTLAYGEGKARAVGAWAAERGVALSDCVFYSDSMSDRPLLDLVGEPVAVNPDPRLAAHALRQGWRVEDWR